MDIQRTKEGTYCWLPAQQPSSSKQADVFEAFSPAMAGESHGRAARGGIFGDAVQVVDGVLSGGKMGGAWRSNGPPLARHQHFSFGAQNPFGAQGEKAERGAERRQLSFCYIYFSMERCETDSFLSPQCRWAT